MKFSEGIQKSLQYGYLFLITIGILKESVKYYQIGISILKYSTITDILISPIADLASHPIILIAVIVLLIFSYATPVYLSKQRHRKWVQKLSGLQNKGELSEEELGNHFTNLFIKIVAMTLLSFFVGIGLGEGAGLSKKIMSDKLEYNRILNYNSGVSEPIYLINSNSMYYFYLTKNNKNIKIAPISAIKNIELTNNDKLK